MEASMGDVASARAARAARPCVLAIVALLACGKSPGAVPPPTGFPSCEPAVGGTTLANLGPDLTIRVLCASSGQGAVASVNQIGPGEAEWSTSIVGAPELTLENSTNVTCQSTGTTVAIVNLQAGPDSKPGDSYDAVVTITAANDAFPTGQVKVHGEVVAPKAFLPSIVDFGDVPANTPDVRIVHFLSASPSPLTYVPTLDATTPFSVPYGMPRAPNLTTTDWLITFAPSPPGDYTVGSTWTVAPAEPAPPGHELAPGCILTQAITLHAHVVDPDGGTDADLGATD
jgi:hypothetical protein